MNCPKCSNVMVLTRATAFGEEYQYCRSCKKELKELKEPELLKVDYTRPPGLLSRAPYVLSKVLSNGQPVVHSSPRYSPGDKLEATQDQPYSNGPLAGILIAGRTLTVSKSYFNSQSIEFVEIPGVSFSEIFFKPASHPLSNQLDLTKLKHGAVVNSLNYLRITLKSGVTTNIGPGLVSINNVDVAHGAIELTCAPGHWWLADGFTLP